MKHLNILLIITSVFCQNNLFANNSFAVLNVEKDSVHTIKNNTTSVLEIIENNIVINWETTTDKNCTGFEIEKSKDRKNWTKVGFVHIKKGSNNYRFVDSTNRPASNYYRVKRLKVDGSGEKSEIIVELKSVVEGQSFSMSSNPVGNYLLMNNSQGAVSIYNADSELIKEFSVKEESIAVDTSDLSKGQYILYIEREDLNFLR